MSGKNVKELGGYSPKGKQREAINVKLRFIAQGIAPDSASRKLLWRRQKAYATRPSFLVHGRKKNKASNWPEWEYSILPARIVKSDRCPAPSPLCISPSEDILNRG
jgi:hypothetical protein